jgi:carboxypeptidase Q
LSLNKECGTNSSETSNIIGNGFGKPNQHVLLGFGEVCGRAGTDVFNDLFKKVTPFQSVLQPYGIEFSKGSSGADIGPLKPLKFLMAGLRPDSQRYFDFHHTTYDKIEAVNRRELELGSAAMTALIYLIDKNGL